MIERLFEIHFSYESEMGDTLGGMELVKVTSVLTPSDDKLTKAYLGCPLNSDLINLSVECINKNPSETLWGPSPDGRILAV